jgi:hypothetical protein
MRKLNLIGLILCGCFASSAVVAATAFALESTWLVSGAKPAAAVKVDMTGKLLWEDMSFGAAIECTDSLKGTAGPGAKGTITEIAASGCSIEKGCTTVDTIAAVDLPWTMTVVLSGIGFLGVLSADGSGSPGFLIECTILGLLADDVCTKVEQTASLENLLSEVNLLFNTEEEWKCSLGGEKAGLLDGTITTLTESGAALAVSEG